MFRKFPNQGSSRCARMSSLFDKRLLALSQLYAPKVSLIRIEMNTEVEVNPYELLDVKVESTEQEIRTAYRKRSLKVHPDRVRAMILCRHECNLSISDFRSRIPIMRTLVSFLRIPST